MSCRKCQLFNTIISIITASLILIANCPTDFAAQDYWQSSFAILFKKMRCVYESTEDGERILHFYKKSAAGIFTVNCFQRDKRPLFCVYRP